MRYVNSLDFKQCQNVIAMFKENTINLSDDERLSLSIVAGNYCLNEKVTPNELDIARSICRKHLAN
jgi:hypothetical protein